MSLLKILQNSNSGIISKGSFLFGLLVIGISGICKGQLSPEVKIYKSGETFFTVEWLSEMVKAKATSAPSERSFAMNELDKAFGKYPKEFNSACKTIFLVGNLIYKDIKYQGAHTSEKMYIATRHNFEIEKTFHRVFLQILLKNNRGKFNFEKWKLLSTPAIQQKQPSNEIFADEQLNPFLFEEGYLTNFSLRSGEIDIAIYAENLFAGGRQFWKVVDHFPLIRKKAQVVIDFYHNLYPIYTENWFRFIADYRLF